ncbi:hypothetical protein BOX15_Mlig025187g2 [Macrostomum lignano]|uniref:NADH dehydrogenase [ubiquinone] 1 beta subcomplex subunit 9 n=1 Tax=Macrostomum lignano TaxID=282301 RepID=A0A267G047_9PLAT|nr:hypothetical protein BOX15_Mlig005215g1 [Macrostomum lignano]PAA79373.1 hypothetical protein BOX15_Mlig025187g4 [Macrostomum lignano]PAA84186.1 hypothetical protein BOX15_Mlig025187g2 [Macrostomum lignano]
MPTLPGPPLPAYLRTSYLSHAQKVCRLYKAALYEVRAKHHERLDYRYHAVLLRQRFDENREVEDPIKAKALLESAYSELQAKKSYFPFRWPNDPGGVAFGRWQYYPDALLDLWHPLEKAQYPDYFARREQRKKEYIERWHQKYGQDARDTGEWTGPMG